MTSPTAIPRLGWHWSEGRDGRPTCKTKSLVGPEVNIVMVDIGTTVRLDDDVKIEPCRRGFHYCPDLLDSLRYGTGTFLSRVRGHGTLVQHGDKVAAQSRTVIWWFDARDLIAKWTTTWHVRPGPFQLAMVHSVIVAEVAEETWEMTTTYTTEMHHAPPYRWDSLFNEGLDYYRRVFSAQATEYARTAGQWRHDSEAT